MKRKAQFLKAIEILAPGDKFILKAAQNVAEETLPAAPDGPALELVVAVQKLIPLAIRDTSAPNETASECGVSESQLSISHALRIQSAHYWLELGEVNQALLELGALSANASNHPLAVKARVAVAQAASRQNEATYQA